MASIKIFQSVQICYQTLGLYSPQSDKIQPFNLRILFFTTAPLLIFSSLLGFILFEAKTIQEYGVSFYGSVAVGVCISCIFETVRHFAQLIKLIKHFKVFVEKRCHHSRSAKTINRLIVKIEWVSKLVHLIFVKWSTTATIVPPLLVALINFFILGMGSESFRFDGTFWFPFDPNTPVGFFVALLWQGMSIFAELSFITPIVCIFIGSCWSVVTFLKDVARDISHLNKRRIVNLRKDKLIERFRNFVRFHADVEELTMEFNNIYEYMIFAIFVYGLGTLASSLIVFQSSIDSPNPVELFTTLCLIIWSFAIMFFTCEIGQSVSNQFNKFSDDIDKCDWYSLPHKLQQMLIIIIINAQEPVSIRGFGNFVCTRDSFKQTIHAGFSYFTMLHQMDD